MDCSAPEPTCLYAWPEISPNEHALRALEAELFELWPLSVGRKARSISPALQRALKSRDGGCRFPGCDRTRFTEGHHVKHWAAGGETKLTRKRLATVLSRRVVRTKPEPRHTNRLDNGSLPVARRENGLRLSRRKPDSVAQRTSRP